MIRIGFDIGGSKLAAIALGEDGTEVERVRRAVPTSYRTTLAAIVEIACALIGRHGHAPGIGIAMPGMIGAAGELIRVVNLPWLEGRPLRQDLEAGLGLPVLIANDANCFALSEARDGAATGAAVVFAVILGTGVGGGLVVDGRPLAGAHAPPGAWGPNPLPNPAAEDGPAIVCGCGRTGCVETWLNGPALSADYHRVAGLTLEPATVGRRIAEGEAEALRALRRYERRLAAALGAMINVIDPDVFVLGGGLSSIQALYRDVPGLWSAHTVAGAPATRLVQARHGPDSGLRGAAWLLPGQ